MSLLDEFEQQEAGGDSAPTGLLAEFEAADKKSEAGRSLASIRWEAQRRKEQLTRSQAEGKMPFTNPATGQEFTARAAGNKRGRGFKQIAEETVLPVAAYASSKLGELATPPTKVAAEDPLTGATVSVPQEEGWLKRRLRREAKWAQAAAGLVESNFTLPYQATTAAMENLAGDPKAGQQITQEIAQGFVEPIQSLIDFRKTLQLAKEDPNQLAIDTVMVGLMAVGGKAALAKYEGKLNLLRAQEVLAEVGKDPKAKTVLLDLKKDLAKELDTAFKDVLERDLAVEQMRQQAAQDAAIAAQPDSNLTRGVQTTQPSAPGPQTRPTMVRVGDDLAARRAMSWEERAAERAGLEGQVEASRAARAQRAGEGLFTGQESLRQQREQPVRSGPVPTEPTRGEVPLEPPLPEPAAPMVLTPEQAARPPLAERGGLVGEGQQPLLWSDMAPEQARTVARVEWAKAGLEWSPAVEGFLDRVLAGDRMGVVDLSPEAIKARRAEVVKAKAQAAKYAKTTTSEGVKDKQAKVKTPKGRMAEAGFLSQDVFDAMMEAGVWAAKRAKDFAGWAGQMVKAGYNLSADALKGVWEQVKQVLKINPEPKAEQRVGSPEMRETFNSTIAQKLEEARASFDMSDPVMAGRIERALTEQLREEYNRRNRVGEPFTPEEVAAFAEVGMNPEQVQARVQAQVSKEAGDWLDLERKVDGARADLKRAWRDVGKKTQSGGLGDLGDLAGPMLKIAAYHLKRAGRQGYEGWKAAFEGDLKGAGIPFNPETAKRIWDSPEMSALRAQVGLDTSMTQTAERAPTPDLTTPQAAELRKALDSRMPDGDTATATARVHDGILQAMHADGPFQQRLTKLAQADHELYTSAVQAVSSEGYARTLALYDFKKLEAIFGEGKAKKGQIEQRANLFMRFLNSERAKALKARNAQDAARFAELKPLIEEIQQQREYRGLSKSSAEGYLARQLEEMGIENGAEAVEFMQRYLREGAPEVTIPELTPAEEAAFANDPAMGKALQFWKEKVMPEVESRAQEAGVRSRMETPSGVYHHVLWKDAAGNLKGLGDRGEIQVKSFAKRKAKAARKATGAGGDRELNTDLLDALHYMYSDRFRASTVNRVRELVKARGSKTYEPGKQAVDLVTYTGPGTGLLQKVWVDPAIADAYRLVIEPHKAFNSNFMNQLVNITTGLALMVPAEAVMHGFGAAMVYKNHPGVGWRMGKTGRTMAQFPLGGRMMAAMADVMAIPGDELVWRSEKLAEHGGLRTTHFGHMTPSDPIRVMLEGDTAAAGGYGLPVKLGAAGAKWAFSWWAHPMRDYVFSAPRSGGVTNLPGGGLETRLRVAMWKALETVDPRYADPALAANAINNEMGTYVSKLVPRFGQKWMAVDPFTRAGIGLTRSAVKRLAGFDARGKFSWEAAMRPVSATLSIMILQKLVDDEGRWPWEIPGLRPGDIQVTLEDGRKLTIPFRYIDNTLYRGLNFTGLRLAGNSWASGQRDADWVVKEWSRGVANFWLGRVGPPGRLASTAATGRAPFLMADNTFLPVAPPSENQFASNIGSAVKQAFPLGKKVSEAQDENMGDLTRPTSSVMHFFDSVAKTAGIDFQISPADKEARAEGAGARARSAHTRRIVDDIAFKMHNHSTPIKWALQQVNERISDPQERAKAIPELVKRLAARPKSSATSAARQEQYLNSPAAQ